MAKSNKKTDEYIAAAAPFAKPILKHFRKLVHECCPECEEKIKWGFPNFDYKGPLCHMAAFKEHCAFGFWKAKLMKDPRRLLDSGEREAMGHFGRITSLKDLPSDKIMKEYIRDAVKLNEEGVKLPPRTKVSDKEKEKLITPPILIAALKKNKKADAVFERFSYSQKKEYITWITEAKTETTRQSRLDSAVEWISEGKIRNWKYLKK
ncbi:MAG TPA: YdeI/OmpD-associated family protein [Bacteroidia bacterium]|jgi:uncharacterized protein YdeI (YjbR/CyaY-like superfamily)|nr:YdeI/OmpD-associated family protein [Bacteroidia bacterium]